MKNTVNDIKRLDTTMIGFLLKKGALTASAHVDFFNEYVKRCTVEEVVENLSDIYETMGNVISNDIKKMRKDIDEKEKALMIEHSETEWTNAHANFVKNYLFTYEKQIELTRPLMSYLNKFFTGWQQVNATDLDKKIITAKNLSEISLLMGGSVQTGLYPTSEEDTKLMFEELITQNIQFVKNYRNMLKDIFNTDFLDRQIDNTLDTLNETIANKERIFENNDLVKEQLAQLAKDSVNTTATFEKLPSLTKLSKDQLIRLIEDSINNYSDSDKEKLLTTFVKKFKVGNEIEYSMDEIEILTNLTRFKYLSDSKITKEDSKLYLEVFNQAFKKSKSDSIAIADFRKEFPFFPFTEKTPVELYYKMGEIFMEYAKNQLAQKEAEAFAKSLQFGLLLNMKDVDGMQSIYDDEMSDFLKGGLTTLYKSAGFDFNGDKEVTLNFVNEIEKKKNDGTYNQTKAYFLYNHLRQEDDISYEYRDILILKDLSNEFNHKLSSYTLQGLELLYLLTEKSYSHISKEDLYTKLSLQDAPTHYIQGTLKNSAFYKTMGSHMKYRLQNGIFTEKEVLEICTIRHQDGNLLFTVPSRVLAEVNNTPSGELFQTHLNELLKYGTLNLWNKKTYSILSELWGGLITKGIESLYPIGETLFAKQIYNDYCNTVAISEHEFIYQYIGRQNRKLNQQQK